MWSVSSVIKLYKHKWNRVKIHLTIPNFLQVIDPYLIMSLVLKVKQRCDLFIPYSNFTNESGRRCDSFNPYLNFINKSGTKSIFILPKFLQLIDPYRIMSLVFYKWNIDLTSFFPYLNLIKESDKDMWSVFSILPSLQQSQDSFYHT